VEPTAGGEADQSVQPPQWGACTVCAVAVGVVCDLLVPDVPRKARIDLAGSGASSARSSVGRRTGRPRLTGRRRVIDNLALGACQGAKGAHAPLDMAGVGLSVGQTQLVFHDEDLDDEGLLFVTANGAAVRTAGPHHVQPQR